MASVLGRAACLSSRLSMRSSPKLLRPLSTTRILASSHNIHDPPRGQSTRSPSRGPPGAPAAEKEHLQTDKSPSFLGTTKRMPEFSLTDKVVLVSGGARGLGLTQAEALLEAGATVYALDRLPEPSPDFHRVQQRAAEELGTTLLYRQVDVRDEALLNGVVSKIGDEHGRMDGLLAAAGIQQETPALEYTAKDANTMFEINITGVFMTAQAVAKQMIRFGNGGSMLLIASMSGTVANRVRSSYFIHPHFQTCTPFPQISNQQLPRKPKLKPPGPNLPRLQRLQSRRDPARAQSGVGMGPVRHPRQHAEPGLHRDGHGRGAL